MIVTYRVYEGDYRISDRDLHYATGTSLAQFPADGGHVVRAASLSDAGHEMLEGETKVDKMVPVLGLLQVGVT